jgi:peptidoglycan/LPS O-acetylase OafA/YrhL
MSYIADFENNGYSGGYFAHYKVFFTRWTDLSGTDGGFTPAHLWFILYLFAISIISLAVILPFKKSKNVNKKDENTPIIVLILLGIIPLLVSDIANIGGKSLAEYFIFYIFGYYIFSKDENIQRLFKCRYLLLSLTILNGVLYGVGIGRFNNICIDIFSGLYGWLFLLSVIGFSSKFFNFSNKIMKFLRNNSFLIYQFHYPVLIIFAYIFRSEISKNGTFLPILIILTFIFTIPISWILSNMPGLKILFGKK